MPPVPGAPAQPISVQIHAPNAAIPMPATICSISISETDHVTAIYAPPFMTLAIAYYRILYIALSRKSIVFRSPTGIVRQKASRPFQGSARLSDGCCVTSATRKVSFPIYRHFSSITKRPVLGDTDLSLPKTGLSLCASVSQLIERLPRSCGCLSS